MEQRRVSLLVGRKSYNILTSLEDSMLKEVYEVLHDAAAVTDASMDQDERLFLAGMSLANEIVSLHRRNEKIMAIIDDERRKP